MSLLVDARTRCEGTTGLTDLALAQAARAKSVRLESALIGLRLMVCEIRTTVLDPLPLIRHT